MLDLISKLFDKHTWFNLLVVLCIVLTAASGLVIFIYYFPVTFQLQTSVYKDESYDTFMKTYRVWSSLEKENGAVVHASITTKQVVKRNNLVEKPVS